jgi:hypothetical protein
MAEPVDDDNVSAEEGLRALREFRSRAARRRPRPEIKVTPDEFSVARGEPLRLNDAPGHVPLKRRDFSQWEAPEAPSEEGD